MSRTRQPLAALALIALAAMISACGSSAPASAGTGDINHAKGVKFAECMRANGVSDFPDPNTSGALTLDGVVNGSSLNPNAPAFKQALGACKHLEPAGFTGRQRSAQQQEAAVKFAQCVRQNGVPDFPDPTTNGPIIDTNRIPSAATSAGKSMLRSALRQCGATYNSQMGVQPK